MSNTRSWKSGTFDAADGLVAQSFAASPNSMASKSESRRWYREHLRDEFVKMANKAGYRSRAVYKLAEIDQRDQLFKPGMLVIDLGAAPGSWSQYALEHVGIKGQIIALDRLEMQPLSGVDFICADFATDEGLQSLMQVLKGRRAGLVMSDMAPNITGVRAVDQPRSMDLVELARDLAKEVLAPGGSFLTKMFQGEGSDVFIRELRQDFAKVTVRKPKASKPRSREVYILSRSYNV